MVVIQDTRLMMENVTVLDDKGNIVAVYDYSHPDGIEWSDYVKENEYYMANKQD